MPYGGGGGMGSNPYGTRPYKPPTRPSTPNTYNPVANANKPGTNPRVDWLDTNMPEWRNAQGYQQGRMADALWQGVMGSQPQMQMPSMYPTSGGRGGGGGGGGGGGPAGLDQATLDWLFGQIGAGRPQDIQFNPIDLPELNPFDTSQYDTARAGVTSGIDAMRTRGNQALDQALGEINQFKNPFAGGMQTTNPDLAAQMAAMARANNATTALQGVTGEGIQADRAFGNAQALMAGAEQSRNAANKRAIGGDRRTMETNLGLEGNMLGLGVNMAQAKARGAYDERAEALRQQEAMLNWQRNNQVGDTNASNRNAWNSGLMQTLMSIISARAPGTTLPTDWASWYGSAPAAAVPGAMPGRMPGAVSFGSGGLGEGPLFTTQPVRSGVGAPKKPGARAVR